LVISPDGSDNKNLTEESTCRDLDVEAMYPEWSPDGSTIGLVRIEYSTGEGIPHIYVMNPDGSDQTLQLKRSSRWGFVWSPDGTRVAYEEGDLVVLRDVSDVEGRNPTFLTHDGRHPSWQRLCTKGTEGADALEGTPSSDLLCGLGGADTMRGSGGYDTLKGGMGNDVLIANGDGKADTLTCGKGKRDTARYEKGTDSVAKSCEIRRPH
jgi:hypothetical protein